MIATGVIPPYLSVDCDKKMNWASPMKNVIQSEACVKAPRQVNDPVEVRQNVQPLPSFHSHFVAAGSFGRSTYKKTKINVSTIPPKAKYNPFRKTSVLGINIQKADKTKNNKATPKKIFRK